MTGSDRANDRPDLEDKIERTRRLQLGLPDEAETEQVLPEKNTPHQGELFGITFPQLPNPQACVG